MRSPALTKIRSYLLSARQWYLGTSVRALDQACDAALKIKKIEDEHFGGNKISFNADYGDAVSAYFQGELKRYLRIAKYRLMEFRASNSIVNRSKPATGITTKIDPQENRTSPEAYTLDAQYALEVNNKPSETLEKLKFVDSILAKYKVEDKVEAPLSPSPQANLVGKRRIEKYNYEPEIPDGDENSVFRKSGFIPRSIFRTASKVREDLDSNLESEEEAVKKYRKSKVKTRAAIRFLLLLVIVPLLTQQVSKNFIFGPLVDRFQTTDQIEISINSEVGERVLTELGRFEEKIRFQRLLGQLPDLSPEKMEEMVREKVTELAEEYSWMSTNPVKNVFADALSLGAFAIIVATGQREIAILKSFIDDVVYYNLSDSAKAFIIILFTDVFVGFHSPHGWEVIIDGTLRHFGLPENENFVGIFIATFPVMLDTVFKYWIFRYLNGISPSAVATYRNMNE